MHRRDVGAGGDLVQAVVALVWFVISYLPFVLIAAGTGVGLSKYANLSSFVAGILGCIASVACLALTRAARTACNRLEEQDNIWYLPVLFLIVVVVAGPPFALGYAIGASFVSDRSWVEQLIAGGFLGSVIAALSYQRVMIDDA